MGKVSVKRIFVEWQRKPVAFVGYGNVGSARAIEQLRQVAVEFEMAPLRHAVHILPDVMRPARVATAPVDPAIFATLETRADRSSGSSSPPDCPPLAYGLRLID